MQIVNRRTNYPIDRRAYPNVIGFFGLGIVGAWAIVANRMHSGDWSFLSPWDGLLAVAYLFVSALIVYKLRHPDRMPPGKSTVEEAGEATQARVAAALERRKFRK